MACSGGSVLVRHGGDLPGRYGSWKTIYNRFNQWSKLGVINIIFNRLLSLLDAHGLVDWPATALDGSNIRSFRCTAGAQKNIPISQEITARTVLAVVLAPESIWRQTERSVVKYRTESRAGLWTPVCTTSSGRYECSAPERQYEATWSLSTG